MPLVLFRKNSGENVVMEDYLPYLLYLPNLPNWVLIRSNQDCDKNYPQLTHSHGVSFNTQRGNLALFSCCDVI